MLSAHMEGTVFTLARLIVPTIKNMYHIQCQFVDESGSLIQIKLQHPLLDSYHPKSLLCIQVLFLWPSNLRPFSSSMANLAFKWRVFQATISILSFSIKSSSTHRVINIRQIYHILPCAAVRSLPSISPLKVSPHCGRGWKTLYCHAWPYLCFFVVVVCLFNVVTGGERGEPSLGG